MSKKVSWKPFRFFPAVTFTMKTPEETLKSVSNSMKARSSGAYLRFGDGDLFVAMGRDDKYQQAGPELTHAMQSALKGVGENYEIGMPFHVRKWGTCEEGMAPGTFEMGLRQGQRLLRDFYRIRSQRDLGTLSSAIALHYMALNNPGAALSFLSDLRENSCLFIGNENLAKDLRFLLFGDVNFIPVPERNAFNEYTNMLNAARLLLAGEEDWGVVVVACGVASRPLVHQLFAEFPSFYFFDFGSLLDGFMGLETRTWIRKDASKIQSLMHSMIDRIG
jgi:hypothetical protein